MPVPISTSIVMSQLANLYVRLAFLEASVLRATADIKVWKTFLIGLLLADLEHLLLYAAGRKRHLLGLLAMERHRSGERPVRLLLSRDAHLHASWRRLPEGRCAIEDAMKAH